MWNRNEFTNRKDELGTILNYTRNTNDFLEGLILSIKAESNNTKEYINNINSSVYDLNMELETMAATSEEIIAFIILIETSTELMKFMDGDLDKEFSDMIMITDKYKEDGLHNIKNRNVFVEICEIINLYYSII